MHHWCVGGGLCEQKGHKKTESPDQGGRLCGGAKPGDGRGGQGYSEYYCNNVFTAKGFMGMSTKTEKAAYTVPSATHVTAVTSNIYKCT